PQPRPRPAVAVGNRKLGSLQDPAIRPDPPERLALQGMERQRTAEKLGEAQLARLGIEPEPTAIATDPELAGQAACPRPAGGRPQPPLTEAAVELEILKALRRPAQRQPRPLQRRSRPGLLQALPQLHWQGRQQRRCSSKIP